MTTGHFSDESTTLHPLMRALLSEDDGWTQDPDDENVAWKLRSSREQEKYHNIWLMVTPAKPESLDTWLKRETVVFWGIWTGEWKEPWPYNYTRPRPHELDYQQRFRDALELGLLRLAD